jgi:hypothetical protein
MKKLGVSILIAVSLILTAKAQQGEVEVGLKTQLVSGNRFASGSNFGYGLFAGYRTKVLPKWELDWHTRLGVDFVPGCKNAENCSTWWFKRSLTLSSYLEKTILNKGDHLLSAGLGYSVFYGSRLSGSVVVHDGEGNLLGSGYTMSTGFDHGASLIASYRHRKISDRLRLNYALYWDVLSVGKITINSISLAYRLGKPGGER